MKRQLLLLFVLSIIYSRASAQDTGIQLKLGPVLSVGEFFETHPYGAGIEVGPSNHTFRLQSPRKIAFTYGGGFTWYHGRKELVPDVTFDYPEFYVIHAVAGILYLPKPKLDFKLQAGPALGFYRGDTRFNIAATLGGGYHFNGTWSIHPSLWLLKERKSDPVYAASLKMGYSF